MLFAILTLLTAFALAAVAGWFSIIGIMAILAGSPGHALVAGVVIEGAKLVTTSWIYRNWAYASWKLRSLLMFFTAIIMLVTSLGVFGFLSKAHLEQAAPTIDNAAKVDALDRRIEREKATIATAERTLLQLDATLDSYIGKDRADRSVVIRARQESQRKQLKEEISAAQREIDVYSKEKFELQSQIRELELKVGPIRYIAELIYGSENNSDKDIENAVKIFILLLVLTLDPLAITLLVAANNTLLRLKNEKEKNTPLRSVEEHSEPGTSETENPPALYPKQEEIKTATSTATLPIPGRIQHTEVHDTLPNRAMEVVIEKTETVIQEDTENTGASQQKGSTHNEVHCDQKTHITEPDPKACAPRISRPPQTPHCPKESSGTYNSFAKSANRATVEDRINQMSTQIKSGPAPLGIIRSPLLTRVASIEYAQDDTATTRTQSSVLNELLGVKRYSNIAKDPTPHFVPLKVKETEIADTSRKDAKYPKTLGWLKEFTRT